MSKTASTYSEAFMEKAAVKSGSSLFQYLTLKVPVELDKVNAVKAWDVSNCVTFVWNRFSEHQMQHNWNDSYESIKRLLPGIKCEHPWLYTASSQVLQEVAKSHSAATKACRTRRKRKGAGGNDRDITASFPGFKSRKYFQSHKYPQQKNSFGFKGKILRLAYGKTSSDWIEAVLPHEISEASVKCVTLTHNDKTGFSVSLETVFELPKINECMHSLIVVSVSRTALTCLRSDGTVWEYDISPLCDLNADIYRKIDDLMSRMNELPCAVKLAEFRKEQRRIIELVGPVPAVTVLPEKPVASREYRRLAARRTKLFASMRDRTRQYLHTMAARILKDHPMVTSIYMGDRDARKHFTEKYDVARNETISRALQNSYPLGVLIKYLKYQAPFQAKKVEEFDETRAITTCSECGHGGDLLRQERHVFKCEKCGFAAPEKINAARHQLKIAVYGRWHALKPRTVFSSVRTSLAPLSCVNSRRLRAQVSLTTGMHGVA